MIYPCVLVIKNNTTELSDMRYLAFVSGLIPVIIISTDFVKKKEVKSEEKRKKENEGHEEV
uniref:Uncharacterized protein n=1 Tax=Wuchereria bancrofti TaxID=6293 RepID=A0AAF5RT04_WUCBA